MPPVRFICLANSNKMGGRCIAGLRLDGRGWIRPVAAGSFGELNVRHYRLNDGTEPCLLDVLEVNLNRPVPEPHQPENFLISNRRWRLVERPASGRYLKILESHLVRDPDLFGNFSDRVPRDNFNENPATSSLVLLQPETLRWNIEVYEGRRKTRAFFKFRGRHYDLAITDPVWKNRISHLSPGTHPLIQAGLAVHERILLTVSLGEPFEGFCYKLVAAVIIVPT